MGFFSKVIDFLSAGFGSKIVETVKEYFPPSMTDKEKMELELKLLEASRVRELELLKLTHVEEAVFNQRIIDLEGTASDLKQIRVLGPIILFLRGCQRPAFGVFTLVMDYQVFTNNWKLPENSIQESAFFAINLLVLGFLFGERAVKNLLPLFERYIKKD